jgi:Ca2+-binding RTX toxin-like protein
MSLSSRPALVEALEGRRLLAATLSSTGLLTINGTTAGDLIVVATVNTSIRVRINAAVQTFANAAVKSIKVLSGAGDDNVLADRLSRAASFDLSTGEDFLTATNFNDTVVCGTGGDSVEGNGGNDSILGGDGNDHLDGGDGNDTIRGNIGNDAILGRTGNDRLYGDAGNDRITTGLGADSADGGEGNDVLFAMANDGLKDTLLGGTGYDAAHVRATDLRSGIEAVYVD